MDCDIIGFQEVFSHKVLRRLVKELGFKYFKVIDVAKLSKQHKTTYRSMIVAIASKYPICDIQTIISELDISLQAQVDLPNKIPIWATTKTP